jgi:hypothetical protein
MVFTVVHGLKTARNAKKKKQPRAVFFLSSFLMRIRLKTAVFAIAWWVAKQLASGHPEFYRETAKNFVVFRVAKRGLIFRVCGGTEGLGSLPATIASIIGTVLQDRYPTRGTRRDRYPMATSPSPRVMLGPPESKERAKEKLRPHGQGSHYLSNTQTRGCLTCLVIVATLSTNIENNKLPIHTPFYTLPIGVRTKLTPFLVIRPHKSVSIRPCRAHRGDHSGGGPELISPPAVEVSSATSLPDRHQGLSPGHDQRPGNGPNHFHFDRRAYGLIELDEEIILVVVRS